jgi:F420-dependent oxidoreductase-like protein
MLPEVAIMIEGQNGLNWQNWQRLARAVEDLGFAGLYRSDHFTNAQPPDLDSLELWVSLAWLASQTQKIEFGPLVSPVSFRHPAHTARMAAAIDDLSAGRLTLGLGAGWQDREHEHYGFDLLDVTERFARFEEGLQVITRLLQSDELSDFSGKYFTLKEAVLLPRPKRRGGPPILIGGNGEKLTLPLAARYASEWNAVLTTPAKVRELNQKLDGLLEEAGRRPGDARRSLMTGTVFGRDRKEAEQKTHLYGGGKLSLEELRERGLVAGGPDETLEQLTRFQKAGVQRVMLQWLDLDDLDGLEALARAVFEA